MKLQIDSLNKYYDDFHALKNVSFTVEKGDFLAILGPNGAGKSTMIRILCGFDKPESGKVVISTDGGVQTVYPCNDIGYCPQAVMAWSDLTCREQLTFVGEMNDMSKADAHKRADELLEMFGLKDKTHTLLRNLSGGMQRRVNVAIALVSDPGIIILDEPYAGLDTYNQSIVSSTLTELRDSGRYIIAASLHNIPRAEYLSNKVAIMDQGSLLAFGDTEEIKRVIPGKKVLEINFKDVPEIDIAKAYVFLHERYKTMHKKDKTFFIEDGDQGHLGDIVNMLNERGVLPQSIVLREITLEDVFFHYTGREMKHES